MLENKKEYPQSLTLQGKLPNNKKIVGELPIVIMCL